MSSNQTSGVTYKKTLLSMLVFSSLGLAAQSALAEINFNGFASVGGGIFSEDDFVYQGVDDEFTSDPYNKFAIQARSAVNDKIDITGQLIARGASDYELEAEWAYVSYRASDSTDIRIGRMRSPFYLYSDFLDVGFAYPWISPPSEVYRLPFSTVTGVDLINQHSLGEWSGSLQLYYGRFDDEALINDTNELQVELTNFTGLNYSLSNDWLTLRLSYNRADYTIESPEEVLPLLSALETSGFGDVADALAVDDEDGVFYGVGLNIDYNNWLMTAEFTVLDAGDQSLISEDEAWYVLLGRRFGDVTVHATYVEQESDSDLRFLDSIPDVPATQPLIQGAIAAVNANASQDNNIILGLRYDFSASTAFKLEINQVEQDILDRDGTLVSFAIDTVF